MHTSPRADHRHAVVVERDWINDCWVVTRSTVAADGSQIACVRSEYPCEVYTAAEVETIVHGSMWAD